MKTTLRKQIDKLVAKHGSLCSVSRVTAIDTGYLSRLRSGNKTNPDTLVLRRLGLRRVIYYECVR